MDNIKYEFEVDNIYHDFEMIFVEGTNGKPFLFGIENDKQAINVNDFFISKYPVTQLLWKYVMGNNPSHFNGNNRPAECVSWNRIVNKGGFLEQISVGSTVRAGNKQLPNNARVSFRLPSETEWEYAARGGKNWIDNFEYSGSNNIDEVAWYEKNSQNETKPVGQKASNQLGIYDMNGNIWEWCQDYFNRDTNYIPKDGRPFLVKGTERVLRGGCHHNWAIHCTVSKRYEIAQEYADGCIGFRLVFSI